MNVDAEIYLKQLFGFFDGNTEALKSLIGELSKEKFYKKVSYFQKIIKLHLRLYFFLRGFCYPH